MDIVGESGLKRVHFPLKYNTMLWPLCMFDYWLWNLRGAGIFFKNFLINLCKGSDLEGIKIFLKILYLP